MKTASILFSTTRWVGVAEKSSDKIGWTAGEDVHVFEVENEGSDACGEAALMLLLLLLDAGDGGSDQDVGDAVKLPDVVAAVKSFPAKLVVDVVTAVET